MHISSDPFLLTRFLAHPVPFHQALHERVHVNSSLLLKALGSFEFGRRQGLLTLAAPGPPPAPGPRVGPVHGLERARPSHDLHMAGPQHSFSVAQFQFPSHPGMSSPFLHNQVLRVRPLLPPLTPAPQQLDSEQPTTPSIQQPAAHVPLHVD